MNNRGQVTMFVIAAILIVVVIVLFFLFSSGRLPDIAIGQDFDPEKFVETCVRDEVRKTVDLMLPQGGFVEPGDFRIYNDINVPYLCKNLNYYEPCIMQYPVYISNVGEEIENNIQEEIEQCFILLEQELDDRNYQHSGGSVSTEITLKSKVIEIEVLRDFSFSKSGTARDFSSFNVLINSPLYDLAFIANEIASQEARTCSFEYLGFSLLRPEFDLRKNTLSDSTSIYTIKDKSTGKEMNIAIRGCVIPAGF